MDLKVASKSLNQEELLQIALKHQTEKFRECYLWLEQSMPKVFFEEISFEDRLLIVHNLINFGLQDFFIKLDLIRSAIVICFESPDADLRILKSYSNHGIKNYQSYVSNAPFPFISIQRNLHISQIHFTEAIECVEESFSLESKQALRALVRQRNPEVSAEEFEKIINNMSIRFLRSLSVERLALVLDLFFRAKTRDDCQYEVRYNEDWSKEDLPSMQIVLAWKNTPKHHFLYRIAQIIYRYDLVIKKVNASYVNPYSADSTLVMVLSLHGGNGKAVWDVADMSDFLREFATVKYFSSFDRIDEELIRPKVLKGRMGNFLRSAVNFIHQILVHMDPHLYTVERIEEDLCRHPELTTQICEAFDYKFNPDRVDYEQYLKIYKQLLADIEYLDTGHPNNDYRRKNVLKQALSLVHYCYKTNYFRINYTAISFRLDPKYLDAIPFNRADKFPELPFGIIFVNGMHFFGFHIRFKDLSRGGVRTVFPKVPEHILSESNTVFSECYNLAYTQHKKNKDIPEGGSKAIIFLMPLERLRSEMLILKKELEDSEFLEEIVKEKLAVFQEEQEKEFLYEAQRSFVESLLTILNCKGNGELLAKNVVDYWKRPEYLYLGPDENMHDSMIEWIADYSKKMGYKPGIAFISGKPRVGVNHKEYGVTSLGINVYMEHVLRYLGIDPVKESFTVKLSGGPDGDVAGNQILNLYKYYSKTAKLLALTDVSGTIYDPEGLDLAVLAELFYKKQAIKFYPPNKLHDGGFLVDREVKRKQTAFAQQTLCWRMKGGKLQEDWLSGSDMNHLLRNNVHQVKSDIFIPSGGRPRTLAASNVEDFLDETGKPTARAIIEGANLYLTDEARHFLEDRGVLIVKDSSANKTGVICSSFEVLCSLVLEEEVFLREKAVLVEEILNRLKICAAKEASLLLKTLSEEGGRLTDISERISFQINKFTDDLLNYLETLTLPENPEHPLMRPFFAYVLSTLAKKYRKELLMQLPDQHKKAIIACCLASALVYQRGLNWQPSLVDILPVLLDDLALPD